MRQPGQVQVVSCYELGHQPLAAATALAFLERAGYRPQAVDLAVEPLERLLERQAPGGVRLVAVSVPMHTALHIGVRAARRLRRRVPAAHLCFYGLYAALNADYLLREIADSVIGGEFEGPLVGLADALTYGTALETVAGLTLPGRRAGPHLARLTFPVPSRDGLPGLERYARLRVGSETRLAAAIEASRGCLHHCRHCPIPPVYGGRFFVVPREIVLEDVRRLVRRGVRHVSFADPDFFNGPGHTMALVRSMHEEFPELTFDVTTKIEHLLRQRHRLPELAASGCLFVVSAVESLSDVVLRNLAKGHTRADVFAAQRLLDEVGIVLRPSLVPFTPWTTIDDYLELVDWIEHGGLAERVDPVQLSIRLLVPPGSPLATNEAMRPFVGGLDAAAFSHRWAHPDPRLDRLWTEVSAIVERAARADEDPAATHARVRVAARRAAGRSAAPRRTRVPPARARAAPPRLTEPWFC